MQPADTEEGGEEEIKQPTQADILRTVNKCAASVNTLKEKFGGLREAVALIRQDLHTVKERTTAAESTISDLEDQLPLLIGEFQTTARLAKATNLHAEGIENCLRWNNICSVGLPETVEGRDSIDFVERWLFLTKKLLPLCMQ